jgi:hypothetical protein
VPDELPALLPVPPSAPELDGSLPSGQGPPSVLEQDAAPASALAPDAIPHAVQPLPSVPVLDGFPHGVQLPASARAPDGFQRVVSLLASVPASVSLPDGFLCEEPFPSVLPSVPGSPDGLQQDAFWWPDGFLCEEPFPSAPLWRDEWLTCVLSSCYVLIPDAWLRCALLPCCASTPDAWTRCVRLSCCASIQDVLWLAASVPYGSLPDATLWTSSLLGGCFPCALPDGFPFDWLLPWTVRQPSLPPSLRDAHGSSSSVPADRPLPSKYAASALPSADSDARVRPALPAVSAAGSRRLAR